MTKMLKTWALASAGLVLLIGTQAVSAKGGGGGGGGGGRGGQQAPPAQQPMNSAVTTAQKAYAAAQKDLQAIVDKAFTDYQQTPDWTSAQTDLAQAQKDFTTASGSASGDLADNPDYKQAKADKTQAEADLDAARNADNASPETLTPIAQRIMTLNKKIERIESGANDANPAVTAAKDKLTHAQSAVAQLKQQFADSLKTNADWTASKKTLDKTHQDLIDAETAAGIKLSPSATQPDSDSDSASASTGGADSAK